MNEYVMKVPDIGEGVVEVEIVEWQVMPGERVVEDQHLVDVMTEKATVELTAPLSGQVASLGGEPGDKLAVGAALVVFTDAEVPAPRGRDGGSEAAMAGKAGHGLAVEPALEPVASVEVLEPGALEHGGSSAGGSTLAARPIAAPAVRRRAREAHVDLAAIVGTGKGGRVTHDDLDAFIRQGCQPAGHGAPAASRTPSVVPTGGVEEVEVIGLRRAIADTMTLSKRTIPHFSYIEEADVTEVETLRQRLNEKQAPSDASPIGAAPRLTLLAFVALALVRVLPRHPHLNAHYDGDRSVIRRFDAVHLGIATRTDGGLKVPVVNEAGSLTLWQLADGLQAAADRARRGLSSPAELRGSTITISSLGRLGGIASTPVINPPEVAIIGVNKASLRPVVRDGQVVVRVMMNLSASFDHRAVDGFDAARLIQDLKELLEHPAMLFVPSR